MNPLDIMLWALAAIIAVAALLVVAIGISLIVSVIRKTVQKPQEPSPPNGDTFIFTSPDTTEISESIAREMKRNTGGES